MLPTDHRAVWDDVRMSISAAHAEAFYREVLREGQVWTIRDSGGFPAPLGAGGRRAMPFWSLASRAEKIVSSVDAYTGFEVTGIPLGEWRSIWLPRLEQDGLLLGLNWSGPRATGYDVKPASAMASISAREGSSGEPR
jgi:hypothetical protein